MAGRDDERTRVTAGRDVIREWAEERGGVPSALEATASDCNEPASRDAVAERL